MKILKTGNIENIWIGKCDSCNTIAEANVSEIGAIFNNLENDLPREFAKVTCGYCKNSNSMIFYRKNTLISRSILSDMYEKSGP